ncbi:MAG: glycoside hydrolase 5 family protein [Nitrososphaerales archaeon]
MLGDSGRFKWGVSIDNAWTFAGLAPPKSIIIPHLISVGLPEGPYNIRMYPETRRNIREGIQIDALPSGEMRKIMCKNLAMELKASGIHFVRAWFQWNLFQPKIYSGHDQVFQFPLDDFVSILNDAGIEILAVIGNGYFRFLPNGINLNGPSDYLFRLGEASRQIVRHYCGKIGMWQIENEPNWWLEHFASDWRRGGIWFERGIADSILSLLKKVVNEEDPGTPIMINLEADTARSSSMAFEKYCDVLGLDFYPNYSHSSPINVSEIRVATEAKKIIGKPVMIAETGYPSGPKFLGYSERNQTKYVRAVCEEAYSCDEITGLGMWRLSDTYWISFPFQENQFGLLNMQGYPKPAWFEYQEQMKRLR